MIRYAAAAVAALMLVVAGAQLSAHEEFRIIGSLTKYEVQASKIWIRSRTGKTVSIRLDTQTAISRDKKKVDAAALRAGQSLVIDAYGDTEDDSLAIEIRIVPPIRAAQ